jgi:hypothetical protein
MPLTGSFNGTSGIYRSNCCAVERAVQNAHRFPACQGAKTNCAESNANWMLVQAREDRVALAARKESHRKRRRWL